MLRKLPRLLLMKGANPLENEQRNQLQLLQRLQKLAVQLNYKPSSGNLDISMEY